MIQTRLREEIKEQLSRDSKPRKITNFMIEQPCAVIYSGYACLLMLEVITMLGEFLALEKLLEWIS